MENRVMKTVRKLFCAICMLNIFIHACIGAMSVHGTVKGIGSMVLMAICIIIVKEQRKGGTHHGRKHR